MRKRWSIEIQPIPSPMGTPWETMRPLCITLENAKSNVVSSQEFPLFRPYQWRVRNIKTGEIHYHLGKNIWMQIQKPKTRHSFRN